MCFKKKKKIDSLEIKLNEYLSQTYNLQGKGIIKKIIIYNKIFIVHNFKYLKKKFQTKHSPMFFVNLIIVF